MFTADRDLLVLEPRLFFDIAWTAQKLVDSPAGGTINAAGDTLTITGANLVNLGVDAGMVVLAGGTPLEIVARIDAASLRISRLRATAADALIPAPAGSGLKVVVGTFRQQIQLVHEQLLRTIGIEPGGPSVPGRPSELDITNPRALTLAESLGALHLVFASAAALVGYDSPLWAKARMYADRFGVERRRITVSIDLDSDGEPDALRRPNVIQFIRR